MIRKNNVLILSIILALITIILWLLSKDSISQIFDDPTLSLSQVAALLGSVFLSFELMLVTRAKWLEPLIGPLDRVYAYHKYLSLFSVIAIVVHATTLILGALPNTALAQIYFIPSLNNIAYGTGIVALYLLIATVSVTLFLNLPYHIWKITHRILALSIFFATYHILNVTSDISRSMPLRIWVVSLLTIGIISMLYKVFVYSKTSKSYKYTVQNIKLKNDIVVINMEPVDSKMPYSSGQFAYFSFYSNAVSNEEHPFSLMSNPDSDLLSIGVKKLGDFTNDIHKLKSGDMVIVRGAYGGFGREQNRFEKEIWIGAGIGIAPFLSFEPSVETKLFYCTKTSEDAVFMEELQKISMNSKNRLEVVNYKSEQNVRFSPEMILDYVQSGNVGVRICGPQSMLDSFKEFFKKNNLPVESLIFENFSFFD